VTYAALARCADGSLSLSAALNDTHVEDNDVSQILSPDGNKKVAQALVAMARVAQDKGHLDKALENYRRALKYVPNNKRLQVRIEEVKSALEEGKTLKQFKRDRTARAGGSDIASNDALSPLRSKGKNKRTRSTAAPSYSADEEDENVSPRKPTVFASLTAMTLDYAKGVSLGSKRRKSNAGKALSTLVTDFDADTDSPAPSAKREAIEVIPALPRSSRLPLGILENVDEDNLMACGIGDAPVGSADE